ncbi:LOW QUALITY PROTEIN: kynureninase [Geomicrobium sp. JCM 19038]|nr:LOW QUALITY PROTEIN: kynureninase [Geomicrobium sp. JCM 19038]
MTAFTLQDAKNRDRQDSVGSKRDLFYIDDSKVYMDGNSLGLLSRPAEQKVLELLESWKTYAIDGWTSGDHSWFYLSEKLGRDTAPLVGAKPEEVIVTGSTTVNLHQLVASFFQPKNNRTKILADQLNFPSDIYALQSQLKLKGLDPSTHLVQVNSKDGLTLATEDLIQAMTDDIALIVLPSVLYRSGQVLDMDALTKAAHERGILIGFDLCHSIGATVHQLHDWGVDFAFWCNYKYLNAGPGSTGGLFVHEKHFGTNPGLAAWFASDKTKQFDMNHEPVFAEDAGAFQIGTPHILSTAPLIASLEMFNEVGIASLRERSLRMTDYFMNLIDHELTNDHFSISNPRDAKSRGGHLYLEHEEAVRIAKALKAEGIIPDLRPPNGIRLAPVPLYNTYEDIFITVQRLKAIMSERKYERFNSTREVVS